MRNPLGGEFEWFPWDRYDEVDRGFAGACWVHVREARPHRRLRLRLYAEVLGPRDEGQVFMHLCEKYGERSYCMNPSHVQRATQGENLRHHARLREEAGIPHPMIGKKLPAASPERRKKLSIAGTGRRHTPEARAKMSAARRGLKQSESTKAKRVESLRRRETCPDCGREWSALWRNRHKREGLCV